MVEGLALSTVFHIFFVISGHGSILDFSLGNGYNGGFFVEELAK